MGFLGIGVAHHTAWKLKMWSVAGLHLDVQPFIFGYLCNSTRLVMSIVQGTDVNFLQLHLDWDLLTKFTQFTSCSKRHKMTQTCWFSSEVHGVHFLIQVYQTHSEHLMDYLFFRLWSLIPDTSKPMVLWVLCPSNRCSTGSNLFLSRLPNSCGAKGKPRTTTHERILAYVCRLCFALCFGVSELRWNWLESVLDLNHLPSMIRGLCSKCCWMGCGNWHAARFTDWQ